MSRYYPRDEIATIRRELEKLGSLRGFPVGALFLSAVPTNPAVLLGYGEWEAFGKGRMLAGHDPDDTDFDTAGQTGGAKTKAISAHAGTAVVDHTNHTHAVTSNVTAGFTTIGSSPGTPVNVVTSIANNAVTTGNESPTLSHTVTQPDDHDDLDVMPPYVVVFMWKRVA